MAKTLQFRRSNTQLALANTPLQGELYIDTTQNTITVGDGTTPGGWYLATQYQLNANIAYLQGIENSQNTLDAIQTANIAAAFNQANSAAANTIYQTGVNTSQNNSITYALSTANSAAPSGGYTANSIIVANAAGYMVGPSNLLYFSANNTLNVANLSYGVYAPGLLVSAANNIVAAGSNQGTATQLTQDVNIIASGTGGVVAPLAVAGKFLTVVNRTPATIQVYPSSGHSFDGYGTNTPIALPVNGYVEMYGSTSNQWNTTLQAIVQGAFVSGPITGNLATAQANSIIFANSTGVLSNTSTLQFFTSNNTLQVSAINILGTDTDSGNIVGSGLITTTGNGIGYSTGSGGLVTQATSRTTGVTLNKPSGQITLFSQAMSNTTANTFVFTNSAIGANDFIMFNHWSGGTIGNYVVASNTGVGIANVTIRAINTVAAEAPVLQYVIIKGAAS
jgi:hypothetical protein